MNAARPTVLAVVASALAGCPCREDASIRLTADMTQADVCAANGHRIIVRLGTEANPTGEAVIEKARAIGAKIVCRPEDEVRAWGGGCVHVELPPGMCCSEGMNFFAGSPYGGSVDIPHPEPERRCSCMTTWTLFSGP